MRGGVKFPPMTPSQRAEEALNTILDRCTAAGLLVEPIVHKDWNVEADCRLPLEA